MPQIDTQILYDRDAGHTAHTYLPDSVAGGVATLVESSGVPLGDSRLTIGSVKTASGRRKVTLKLSIPVLQDVVVGGITKPTVVRTAYADVTLNFDATSTTEERARVVEHCVGLFWATDNWLNKVTVDLEGFY